MTNCPQPSINVSLRFPWKLNVLICVTRQFLHDGALFNNSRHNLITHTADEINLYKIGCSVLQFSLL